jgi:HemY protein
MGGKIIMFDSGTGGGQTGGPKAGLLAKANLANAGIDAAKISTIVVTHFHGDHIFGMMAKDTNAQVYPNAEIVVPEAEYNYWTAADLIAKLPEARFLGLRGLLRQAIQREDWPTAQRLAREAEAAQPGAAWVRLERETLALKTRDWREALALAAPGAAQAALGLAAARQEPDRGKATELERQAFRADPGFTPAALAFAARMRAAGCARRARSTLEEAWAKQPHPELATAYLSDVTEKLARMKAGEALVAGKPKHPESHLLLGRLALDAGLTGRARSELEALIATNLADRRAFLVLADLEEAEKGDSPEGRQAQARWLRQAAVAAPEAGWRCGHCGAEHKAWDPVCDCCGSAGTIAWSSPQQQLPVPV